MPDQFPRSNWLLARWNWLLTTRATLLLCAFHLAPHQADCPAADPPPIVVGERAMEIHRGSFVFDGHNDLPWALRSEADSSFDRVDIAQPQPNFNTDIPRLRQANVGAQFWSVFVPMETATERKAFLTTLEQIELVEKMAMRYPDVFEMAYEVSDVERIRGAGKIASLIGVEGGHSIEDSIENLRQLYRRGARYMTLSHSDTLGWVDAATDEARHGGLTPFGEEVVKEMNRLGMMVDLSHVSAETMRAALRISQAPIIFSHSSARAIADHPRNVPDDVLRLTRKNGGVVMVNFFSGFVVPESAARRKDTFQVIRDLRNRYPDPNEFRKARKEWETANPIEAGTVHDVIAHIDHIAKTAGIDHVGLGSDYDGVTLLPRQLEDVTGFLFITQGLLDKGYTAPQIHKIMSGNIMRVMARVEQVAARLR
ncbi:MAG: membrane dipeptidase [Planctomycetes bacterium]|nr:membrane dipeptidase [Planctomycetota bacterium]